MNWISINVKTRRHKRLYTYGQPFSSSNRSTTRTGTQFSSNSTNLATPFYMWDKWKTKKQPKTYLLPNQTSFVEVVHSLTSGKVGSKTYLLTRSRLSSCDTRVSLEATESIPHFPTQQIAITERGLDEGNATNLQNPRMLNLLEHPVV